MYRPGGFHEFNPQQQAVFDAIVDTLASVFRQYHYEHIWTPAVESVDILKKGGDIIDKQVYGLYGLAQGVEDVKDYALHFDLTIPLARYILDHRNDLSFPFRRYQMQPVWRGERTKRGRFKEFRQFDVDAVRPSEINIGTRYDTETVAVLSRAMEAVCKKFAITIDSVLKISHIGLTKSMLASFGLAEEAKEKILGLLDGYYKLTHEEFTEKLNALAPADVVALIQKVIASKDLSLMADYEHYDAMRNILTGLDSLGISYEYDICIVRGHNYYRGMVCEWFDKADIALGSLAAGGRYDNITDFIDPKQSFSGVGTSLGRFVYLAIDKIGLIPPSEAYLFVNFEDTYADVIKLYGKFLAQGKVCELYPTAAKLGKQFEYADKKGLSHVIILGGSEKEAGTYKMKNLATGDETTHSL